MSKNKPKKPPQERIGHLKVELADVEVENPMFSRDHPADRTNPLRVRAKINLRESPIGLLAHRGMINDAQIRAASEFRRLWEAMGGAGVRAMDYSVDPVDGGGIADPIAVRQMDAARKLRDLRAHIGVRPYDIVSKVVGQGIEITALESRKADQLMVSRYLKDGLADAATYWGFQSEQRRAS